MTAIPPSSLSGNYVNINAAMLPMMEACNSGAAKLVSPQKSSCHTHGRGEFLPNRNELHVDCLTLPQLYRIAYLPYMRKQQQKLACGSSLPPTPPDFDDEDPVSPEEARRYLEDLANMYRSPLEDPTPYQLYESLVTSFFESHEPVMKPSKDGSNKDNSLNYQLSLSSLYDEAASSVAPLPLFHSITSGTMVMVHTISAWLLDIRNLTTPDCAMATVKKNRLAVRLVNHSVVSAALDTLKEIVKKDDYSQGKEEALYGFFGFVVLLRGEMKEILEYVEVLEECCAGPASSVVPVTVPHYEELLRVFSPSLSVKSALMSPVDGRHGQEIELSIAVPERSGIRTFCVSPCGQFIAVATLFDLMLLKVDGGRLVARSQNAELVETLWFMQFSSTFSSLILTTRAGRRHVVLNASLEYVDESETDRPAIPTHVADDKLEFLFAPKLPSGRSSSLFLLEKSKIVLDVLENGASSEVDFLVICSHVHSDFSGVLVEIRAHEMIFTVSLADGVIRMAQGTCTCFGAIPSDVPWHFVSCKWERGLWALCVDDTSVELHGVRAASLAVVKIATVTVLDGVGHVSSLAVWGGDECCQHSINRFSTTRAVESTAGMLFCFPLDEGEGIWVKELVTARGFTLLEENFIWDSVVCCPCSPTEPYEHDIFLPQEQFLSARVIVSDYQSLLVFPSSCRGGDEVVAQVLKGCNTITRVYRCSASHTETRYFLSRDESSLYTFKRRLSTFSMTPISTAARREHQLNVSCIALTGAHRGSVAWVCNEILKRVYINGVGIIRIPEEINAARSGDLQYIVTRLRNATPTTKSVKLLALATMGTVYLERFAVEGAKSPLSSVVISLQCCCKKVMGWLPKNLIQDVASSLFNADGGPLLTVSDRVGVLLNADDIQSADVLYTCMQKDSLLFVLSSVVNDAPSQIISMTASLLRRCELERHDVPCGRKVTHLMWWFSIISVQLLHSHGQGKIVSQLLELYVRHAGKLLQSRGWRDSLQETEVHTGLFPLLISVSVLCPAAVTPDIEKALLALVESAPVVGGADVNTVRFEARQEYDVVPRSDDAPFVLALDYKRAKSVVISWWASTSDVHVVATDTSVADPISFVLSNEYPFFEISGLPLVFFGTGEASFTIASNYDLPVGCSWGAIFRECVFNLFTAVAKHLVVFPRPRAFPLAPLFHHGLNSEALSKHQLYVPGRKGGLGIASDILGARGAGKTLSDKVWQSVQGKVNLSMRPVVSALLALLIHCGMEPHEAEAELESRGFSLEWGNLLQGVEKDATRRSIVDFADWAVRCIACQSDVLPLQARFVPYPPQEREGEAAVPPCDEVAHSDSMTPDQKEPEEMKGARKLLSQLRDFVEQGGTHDELEDILVEQTVAALNVARGFHILSTLLSQPAVEYEPRTVRKILDVVFSVYEGAKGKHILENFTGSGVDLESRVRVAFYDVLRKCRCILINSLPVYMSSEVATTTLALQGSLTIQLLSIMCHPWDPTDCELFSRASAPEVLNILIRLAESIHMPVCRLPATWRAQTRWKRNSTASLRSCHPVLGGVLAPADQVYDRRLASNGFSVVIPNLSVSLCDRGVLVEKAAGSPPLVLRADEAWSIPPLTPHLTDVPPVLYYEVELSTSCCSFMVCISNCHSCVDRPDESVYFYKDSGLTHIIKLPPFGYGDTVGCGIVRFTRRVFFTLNGTFMSFAGGIKGGEDSLYPTIRMGDKKRVGFTVNFGLRPFRYDLNRLWASPGFADVPTHYSIAFASEVALHYITTHSSTLQCNFNPCMTPFWVQCCDAVCRHLGNVMSFVTQDGAKIRDSSGSYFAADGLPPFAEWSVLRHIATLRFVVRIVRVRPLPEALEEMLLSTVRVLMSPSLHSVQLATVGLLAELVPHISHVHDTGVVHQLVNMLFVHANARDRKRKHIPLSLRWLKCDTRCVTIAHAQLAQMRSGAQRSVVLGNVLPRVGDTSFTVRICRRGYPLGSSLKGGYYVGVAAAHLPFPISTSTAQGWKSLNPPLVWALHDMSPQLQHATNPHVAPNTFQRSFGSVESIRVRVRREKRELEFYRENAFVQTLFVNVPSDIDLVPFVQLYNDDASAFIGSGEMMSPISPVTLLRAAATDVLRSMITLKPFEQCVVDAVCGELNDCVTPFVTLALFGGVADPRLFEICGHDGEVAVVSCRRLMSHFASVSCEGVTFCEHLGNLRPHNSRFMHTALRWEQPGHSLGGLRQCVNALVGALRRLVTPLVTTQALSLTEVRQRERILEEEKELWNRSLFSVRAMHFYRIQRLVRDTTLLEPSRIPCGHTFSSALSNPCFRFPPYFCGSLATVLNDTKGSSAPFIAIAEPSVPLKGQFSLRFQLLRGKVGQILGGGYYVGVCSASFGWRRRDLTLGSPEAWALHDMDVAPWRLPHLCTNAKFRTIAEPNCIIVSGDIVRLDVNRDEGTIHAYRKGVNQEETPLGLIYDEVPAGEELFPFVHLYNTDAVAVILPSRNNEEVARTTTQLPHFSLSLAKFKKRCDSCPVMKLTTDMNQLKWYKCNECVDYQLCRSCFMLCAHSHHPFTEMGSNLLVSNNTPPSKLDVGMSVVIPAVCAFYLKSEGCCVDERRMHCVAVSSGINALTVWGIAYKHRAVFTVTINTTDGEPLDPVVPTFIGIGEASEVLGVSPVSLRGKLVSGTPGIVALCNDSTLNQAVRFSARSVGGFQNSSTITVEADFQCGEVVIARDWSTLGSCDIASLDVSSSKPNLVGFVLFGQKDITASVLPECGGTIQGVVDDVTDGVVSVSCSGGVKLLRPEHCRVPLVPCTDSPMVGVLVYTFDNGELLQGRVVAVDRDEAVLYVPAGGAVRHVPFSQLLVDPYGVVSEERELNCNLEKCGPTVAEGFAISRFLLILKGLCDNKDLSSVVLPHRTALVDILRHLAAVEISNDVQAKFFSDLQDAVMATESCTYLAELGDKRLDGFVPSSLCNSWFCAVKYNMLVCAIGGVHRGEIFRVVKQNTADVFEGVKIHAPHSRVSLSTLDCIPVKQCAGNVWWTSSSGLPCSLFEHGLRVTCLNNPMKRMTIEGVWEGEISVAGGVRGTISLQLKANCMGEAYVNLPTGSMKYTALGKFRRSSRSLFLLLFTAPLQTVYCVTRLLMRGCHSSFEEVAEEVGSVLASGKRSVGIVIAEGTVDASGLRVSGQWKPREGSASAFVLRSFRCDTVRIPPLSDLAHVEPLPGLRDPTEPPTNTLAGVEKSYKRGVGSALHRLVVLLSRHIYLSFLGAGGDDVQAVVLYHSSPMAEKLFATCADGALLQRFLCGALRTISEPSTKPWDCVTLSHLVTKYVLLRPEIVVPFPSLLWDSFHAIVSATHRCCRRYRQHLLGCIISLVRCYGEGHDGVLLQLLSMLVRWVDQYALDGSDYSEIPEDVAAGVELVMFLPESLLASTVRHIPLAPLRCLLDLAQAFREGCQLPKAVDISDEHDGMLHAAVVEAVCLFGEFEGGSLAVGKVVSRCAVASRGKYYYEVTLPEKLSVPFVVGWGTKQHSHIPDQPIGSDAYSFGFTGNELLCHDRKEEYKPEKEVSPKCTIGCLLDNDKGVVAWSVDGIRGPFVPIPVGRGDGPLYAFVSAGTNDGMRISLNVNEFHYLPGDYSDLAGRFACVRVRGWGDAASQGKSVLPYMPISFYEQLASYLSDLEEAKPSRVTEISASGDSPFHCEPGVHERGPLLRYPTIMALTDTERMLHTKVIRVAESCMATARRFINLDDDVVVGCLPEAFLMLKCIVRRPFTRRYLVAIPQVEINDMPQGITVHVTELYCDLPRTAEAVLHCSILSQIYKQIGSFKPRMFRQHPLFKVQLHITHSGHSPQDLGGPYRQLWTFLSEEIMTHPDMCYPNTSFNRSPLFHYPEHSQRVGLVPNSSANSAHSLALFNLLGKIMAHCIVAKSPVSLDFSPFLWKYMVGDVLMVRDYYLYVDNAAEKIVGDGDFLLSTAAEEIIPNFSKGLSAAFSNATMTGESQVAHYRRVAESCLLHSLDAQLSAIRTGLWAVLPRRVVRCVSWRELERMVCGEPDITPEVMRQWLEVQLPPRSKRIFWRVMDDFSPCQRSSFLCFGCGQKRPPLAAKIRVLQGTESIDHLPRAQSCTSLVTIPPYDTYKLFKEKLMIAINHAMEMELA
ncbi:SPRY domain/HECT-domain (ubiquitin-transferase), putative [Trypanosoma equiperdum]|uniref:SPRY domain/HECT-domain (Ubiquitin-transferase), putative n=1 Tax=Trypanosoma equiperdum TaxID=5694 RepID=A0A1G4I1T5_TRYEQ|nr:SPRY domain/HECT-domain (ubiquitin-transferase), putative [Trypanosoma equiperdum]